MNINLLFSTFIALITVYLVSCVKYDHICDCGYLDVYEFVPGKYNLTFICGENVCDSTFFTNDPTAICKKNDYRFYKSAIGSINFQNCELNEIKKNLFDIYYNVHNLDISHLNIDSLPQTFFKGAKSLSKLFATHNRFVEIPSFWFHNSNNLTEVDFSSNKIKEIDDLAFFGDLNLKKVNLSNNQLTNLNRKLLENHSHLTHLDFSGNRISEIKSNSFQSLRNLVLLDLSSNPIRSIENTTFLTLVKLEHLNLSHALLKVIKSGTFLHQINLKILDLSENDIKILDANIFSPHLDNLELFRVEDNPLVMLNGFTSLIFSKIVGIESEKFKCAFLNVVAEPTNWKSLENFPRKIKCISYNADNEHQNLITSSDRPTSEWLTTKNVKKAAGEVKGTDEMTEARKVMNCKEFHSAESSQHFVLTTWINSVCLIIGVIVLILFVIQKHIIRKADMAKVFYRQNENESLQSIETVGCEAIINK